MMFSISNRSFFAQGPQRQPLASDACSHLGQQLAWLILLVFSLAVAGCTDSDPGGTTDLSGKTGSLARFATTPTHLYAVDNDELKVYQIGNGGAIALLNTIALDPGVETIATRDKWLYIGTNQAMLIYDISTPNTPVLLSAYTHFVGCDPVVVRDTLAFVTLRTTGCRSVAANTLDIVNIKNPVNPILVTSFELESPYGLGVDGNLLFVCEGDNGMKILDVTDPDQPVIVEDYRNVAAFDVIPNDGLLLLTGPQGIVQYDYTDYLNIRQLSVIGIE